MNWKYTVLLSCLFLFPLSAFSEASPKYIQLSQSLGYIDYESRTDLSMAEVTALSNYKSTVTYPCLQDFLFGKSDWQGMTCFLLTESGERNRWQAKANDMKATITNIDSAISKSKSLPPGLMLYRGQAKLAFSIGTPFIRKGYLSTSVTPAEARKFYQGTLLVIKIPQKGFPGILMGEWEEEVLLPRNTILMVIDIKQVGNEYRVLAEPCIQRCVLTQPTPGWEKF